MEYKVEIETETEVKSCFVLMWENAIMGIRPRQQLT